MKGWNEDLMHGVAPSVSGDHGDMQALSRQKQIVYLSLLLYVQKWQVSSSMICWKNDNIDNGPDQSELCM